MSRTPRCASFALKENCQAHTFKYGNETKRCHWCHNDCRKPSSKCPKRTKTGRKRLGAKRCAYWASKDQCSKATYNHNGVQQCVWCSGSFDCRTRSRKCPGASTYAAYRKPGPLKKKKSTVVRKRKAATTASRPLTTRRRKPVGSRRPVGRPLGQRYRRPVRPTRRPTPGVIVRRRKPTRYAYNSAAAAKRAGYKPGDQVRHYVKVKGGRRLRTTLR